MSISGAVLVLFVTFHALMNGVALFWPSAYNVVCELLGANWYALVASAGLALIILLHIVYALWLTVQNRRARGHERYDVTSRPPQVEWASKNMLVLGIVVLAFFIIHLIQFWAKMQLAEILHFEVLDPKNGEVVPPAAGTWFLQMAFSCPWTLVVYIIGFVALWFHLTHGFWSMFQSAGWNGRIWMDRLKTIGNWWVTIVIALFLAEAIVFTVQANREVYTTCPVLLQQYEEMYLDGEGDMNMPAPGQADCAACQEAACPEAAAACCNEANADCANCPNAAVVAEETVTETVTE